MTTLTATIERLIAPPSLETTNCVYCDYGRSTRRRCAVIDHSTKSA